jgi:hypothetical protein
MHYIILKVRSARKTGQRRASQAIVMAVTGTVCSAILFSLAVWVGKLRLGNVHSAED